MKYQIKILLSLLTIILISYSCGKKKHESKENLVENTTDDSSKTTTLSAPIIEKKIYKLLPGYNKKDSFEASGIYALEDYFYVVCDNLNKIAKINAALSNNNDLNTIIATGSPLSNNSGYEGITYDNNNTPNFFVVEEAVKNGKTYSPRISEFDQSLNFKKRMWVEFDFKTKNANKGFEGIAWVHREGEDFMLGLIEGTGEIPVFKKTDKKWAFVSMIHLPSAVSFSDYSDIALYNNKVAITSQTDSKIWIGTLSPDSWNISDGLTYNFPKGDKQGNITKDGTYSVYGNVEGVSFISANKIVVCSDKVKSDQAAYTLSKSETVSVFVLP